MSYQQLIHYALVGVPSLIGLYILYGMGFWIYQGKQLQKTGYMPPPSSRFARWFYKRACSVFCWLFVGPVKVIGAENAHFDGRGVILPNHQFAMDFAVIGHSTPYSYRQVAKAKEVSGLLRGTLAAWIGTVGVQVEGGKAQDGSSNSVIETGKNILVKSHGARLLLFPQGMLVFDNVLRPNEFRTGATRITAAAAAEIGDEPISIQPMAVHYKRDVKDATRFTRIVHGLGLKAFRRWSDYELIKNEDGSKTRKPRVYTTYGATVVVGKAIPVASLPSDPRQAIEAVRVEIQKLLEHAQSS